MFSFLLKRIQKETLFLFYKKGDFSNSPNCIKNSFCRYRKILENEKNILLHHVVSLCSDRLDIKMFSLLQQREEFYIHRGTKRDFLYECIRKSGKVDEIIEKFLMFNILASFEIKEMLRAPTVLQTGNSSLIKNIIWIDRHIRLSTCVPTTEALQHIQHRMYGVDISDIIFFCVQSKNKDTIQYCKTWLSEKFTKSFDFDFENAIIGTSDLNLIKWYSETFSFKCLKYQDILNSIYMVKNKEVFRFLFNFIRNCRETYYFLRGNVIENINTKCAKKLLKIYEF